MSNIHSVENFFEDEESRFIWRQRDNFNKSGDIRHIRDMSYKILRRRNGVDMTGLISPDRKVVLFGSGAVGQEMHEILALDNICVNYFCDNDANRIGKEIRGVKTISPETLGGMIGEVDIIISVSIPRYIHQIREQLFEMGFSDKDILFTCEDFGRQYFSFEHLGLDNGSVFVDCGCYNGDDCISFAEMCPMYKKIYAFEPDSKNYAASLNALKSYRDIILVPRGAWREDGALRFNQGISGGSYIGGTGNDEISVTSIDNVLKGDAATFIKMDIEGAELAALEGAAETIERWRPKLAICVYHRPEDIYAIPDLLKKLQPQYKLYLRHYSIGRLETVLYAV